MEADADLKDPVIQVAHRCGRVAPQELERFVLFEEFTDVELLDAAEKCFWWCIRTAGARSLV